MSSNQETIFIRQETPKHTHNDYTFIQVSNHEKELKKKTSCSDLKT